MHYLVIVIDCNPFRIEHIGKILNALQPFPKVQNTLHASNCNFAIFTTDYPTTMLIFSTARTFPDFE